MRIKQTIKYFRYNSLSKSRESDPGRQPHAPDIVYRGDSITAT